MGMIDKGVLEICFKLFDSFFKILLALKIWFPFNDCVFCFCFVLFCFCFWFCFCFCSCFCFLFCCFVLFCYFVVCLFFDSPGSVWQPGAIEVHQGEGQWKLDTLSMSAWRAHPRPLRGIYSSARQRRTTRSTSLTCAW